VSQDDLQPSAPVLLVIDDGIATIRLNRPERRNVLDAESIGGIATALDRCTHDDVRVVLIASTGPTFCAGADLRGAMAGGPESFAESAPLALANLLTSMLEHPKPLIACVQGDVFGGGNGLVAACDIAVATESARFAFSEVRVGVAPAVVSVVCLMRMRPRDAARLMLTGERVSADVVLNAGLVTDVVAAEEVESCVRAYAAQLIRGGPEALAATKAVLRRVPQMSSGDAFEWTASLSSQLFASAEGREGMAAFAERRDPVWVTEA